MLGRSIPIQHTNCVPHGANLVIEHGFKVSSLIAKVFDVLEQKSTKRDKKFMDKLKEVEN